LETKIEKVKIFFILYQQSTYDKNAAYIFVDFRTKRACRANIRGATFRPRRKVAKYEIYNLTNFYVSVVLGRIYETCHAERSEESYTNNYV